MDFLEILKAALIGVIQGITEWLPISSTGHMILADELIKLNVSPEFWEMFQVVIQLGSIMAVVVLFFHKLNPFSPKKSFPEKRDTIVLWCKVIVAVFPAAVIGLAFDDKLNALFYNYQTVATTLIIYGILFIIMENWNRNRTAKIKDFKHLNYKTALLIGAFQVLALIPGTSRSGATILGAVFLGSSRFVAAEFSFFLAIPVMFGASLLKIVKYVSDVGLHFTSVEISVMITGVLIAFFVSLFAIKFLMEYVKKHDFKVFGYYRIALGFIVLAYFFFLAK